MITITQAFVLGAGLGMRLKPLTDDLPKPLVPIFQKPLITFALDHLIDIGVKSFIINTHRLPDLFQRFFPHNDYEGHATKLVNEPVLLDTGGGIKNVEADLGARPFITYSSDILTDIDLQPLIDEHFRCGNDVTLALRDTGLAAAVAFRNGQVVDISNRYGVAGNHDFANIAVWNPGIFERIPPNRKISFIPIVGNWIGAGGKIGGVVLNDGKSERRRSWKTQFCGPVHKLLPKVTSAVVLSAPTKRRAASIATSTSNHLNYENRSARSTNANAFPASRCRGNKDCAD